MREPKRIHNKAWRVSSPETSTRYEALRTFLVNVPETHANAAMATVDIVSEIERRFPCGIPPVGTLEDNGFISLQWNKNGLYICIEVHGFGQYSWVGVDLAERAIGTDDEEMIDVLPDECWGFLRLFHNETEPSLISVNCDYPTLETLAAESVGDNEVTDE